ncbi:MAG: alkanesulfonate monooxygenase [Candidatus Poriferisodalaceae bacterium]|jgi:alkanesulfonate monooxygenase
MPLKIVGMIGVASPAGDATVHIIDGGVSARYLVEFSQAHDDAGFDLALVGYTSTSADGWTVATHAAANTKQLGFLIAHRPGFVSPTLAARKAATFDQLSEGRFALHIIAGAGDRDQQRDGDYLAKADRYARAAEYIDVMRRTWTSTEPFDHQGTYYQMSDVRSDVRPLQQPGPPVFFGGSSEEALDMGAEHCDVYAVFGEPLTSTADRFAAFSARAAAFGRTPSYSISFRPILGRTEGEAWDRANKILASVEAANAVRRPGPYDHSGERMLEHAAASDVHDERLWMKIAQATGAPGNTSCLVGTAEQVSDALLRYYELGDLSHVLLRGFDPLNDAREFGEELIPRVKAGALQIDAGG